jgi:hypothetical protein
LDIGGATIHGRTIGAGSTAISRAINEAINEAISAISHPTIDGKYSGTQKEAI